MRKSYLFPLVLVGTAAIGCSSSSGTASSGDAGAPKDSGAARTDGARTDAATDSGKATKDAAKAGSDAGPPPTPVGTAIETGANLTINGVTDDGYVIYTSNTTIKAAPVAGGAATTVAEGSDAAGAPMVSLVHDDVFVWTNVDPNTGIGTLSLWTHTLGAAKQVSTTSLGGAAAASSDSSAILFADTVSSDGSTASLVGANVSALTSPTTLATKVDISGGACSPAVAFTGTASPFYLVASFCVLGATGDAGGDAGADGPNTVYSYPSTTWKPVTLATGVTGFAVDKGATSVAVGLASGQLETLPIAGGTAVPIDVPATLAATPLIYLSKTDAFVLYATGAGALKSSTVTTSAPRTLVASNVNGLDGIAPSDAWALVNNASDTNTGLATDLSLASTSTAGTPTSLTTGTTLAGALGDPFTADSTYAIFQSGIAPDSNNNYLGTLNAVSTAKPGTLIPLSKSSLVSAGLPDQMLTGTQILFSDSFNGNVGAAGAVDIRFVDVASTTASKVVMASADPTYFVSYDKKDIIYAITYGGKTDGIYTVPVP